MNNEQKVYELEEIWDEKWFSGEDLNRVKKLSEVVLSSSSKSILDVGCGNGLFLNYLNANHKENFNRICGVERSEIAIKHVKTEKYIASIDKLPFNNSEFEIVSCQEVIEHLPSDIYINSIKELGRVASKYVLISVPYNENLQDHLTQCPYCFTKFNPEYHMRSFTKNNLEQLQPYLNARLVRVENIFVKELMFSNLILFLNGAKNRFPNYTICPMCNYNENSKLQNKFSESTQTNFKNSIKKIWPRIDYPRWIFGLYEKK